MKASEAKILADRVNNSRNKTKDDIGDPLDYLIYSRIRRAALAGVYEVMIRGSFPDAVTKRLESEGYTVKEEVRDMLTFYYISFY